ncbi:MAG: hypothetical protein KAZ88_15740, partial [Acidimicrobiia bacterium]|nr:hypothetical protein [Acidimicrobiia bacterium]
PARTNDGRTPHRQGSGSGRARAYAAQQLGGYAREIEAPRWGRSSALRSDPLLGFCGADMCGAGALAHGSEATRSAGARPAEIGLVTPVSGPSGGTAESGYELDVSI